MATIEETSDTIVAKPKPEQDPVVVAVEELNAEYNKSVEELSTAEVSVQEAQNTVFKFFLDVSKKTNSTEPLLLNTTSYNEVFHEFLSLKEVVYNKQSVCFRLLQKLRLAHNNYLVSVITTLQKEIADSKSAAIVN